MSDSSPATQRIVVLGGGRVGSAIARDLANDPGFEVRVVDHDPEAVERLASFEQLTVTTADLQDALQLQEAIADADLVIGAVPGWMGYATLKTVIEAKKNVVDISFFEQDPAPLDALARSRGVTAVMDCGVAPGLSNFVLGQLASHFERIDRFVCLVGGLPQDPQPPWHYKAPYSPVDVIEMYTRPARLRRLGEAITLPALTEPEILDFPGVGELESFNTDGLRTLMSFEDIPELVERTLRYPGHLDQITLLRDSGFFDHQPRRVGEVEVSPMDLTSQLLFEQWHQGPLDYDLTAMRLQVEGVLDGEPVHRIYDMCDHFDRQQGISSMARTTGYPCAAVARLVAAGTYRHAGVSPPELVGRHDACYRAVMDDLEARDVTFTVRDVSPPSPQS